MTDHCEFSKEMKNAANLHVGLFAKHFAIELDYSERSLTDIDRAISEFHGDGVASTGTYVPYSAYVGEVVRRNLGGRWEISEDNCASLAVSSVDKQSTVYPLTWVAKRFEDGEEGAVAIKYRELKATLGQERELSVTPPPVEEVDEPEGDDDGGAAVEDMIVTAPAMVFLLVAAADGKVGAEEVEAIQRVAGQAESHPNQLFRAAMVLMMADFQGILDELSVSPAELLERLGGMRVEVGKHFAEEVDGFFEALYELGEQIAEAAGGLAEAGGRAGGEEAAALGLIRARLGLEASG